MNKIAYETAVSRVLYKRATLESLAGATQDWWKNLDDTTKRSLRAGGATAILGGILGGTSTKGLGGAVLGTVGGGLLGYHGMKHLSPQWDKWYELYTNRKKSKESGDTSQGNPDHQTFPR